MSSSCKKFGKKVVQKNQIFLCKMSQDNTKPLKEINVLTSDTPGQT